MTVASSGLQLEVVLRKGQRLLDRGPYTGAWTEAALAPRAAAHRATPPSPAVTGRRRGRAAYDASSRRAASRSAARVECARKAAAPAALAMNFNVYSHAPMDLGYWVASPSKHRARWAAHRARRAAAARSVPRTRRVRPRKARLFSSSPVARSWPRRIRSRSTSRARLYIEPLSKCNQIAKTTPTAAEAVCTAPFPLR